MEFNSQNILVKSIAKTSKAVMKDSYLAIVRGKESIDIIDYVNGIGNCSRELYFLRALRVIVSIRAPVVLRFTFVFVSTNPHPRTRTHGCQGTLW